MSQESQKVEALRNGNTRLETRMDVLADSFKDHTKADKEGFDAIHQTLTVMKENHLAHIQTDMAKQSTDIDWIKKILWAFLGPLIGGFIGMIYLIIQSL